MRPIIPWPHPLLSERAQEIREWNQHLKVLVAELKDTADRVGGPMISLSAPQIGSPTRVVYFGKGISETEDGLMIINPKMVAHGEMYQVMAERCLSLFGYEIKVQRYGHVEVEGRRPNGDTVVVKADGLLAQALQHELNHLDGKGLADCCNAAKRRFIADKQTATFKSKGEWHTMQYDVGMGV